eukprot:PhF_6_TR38156/c0_g1_i1/m.57002/K11713/PGTB1; geranylgeranyl transferase type-1 subunit beta
MFQSHIPFFQRIIHNAPSSMEALDPNRMTLLYFCTVAADVLNATDVLFPEKSAVIEWIYRQQVESGGFCSGPMESVEHTTGHITMTHCALAVLLMLGEPPTLPRVRREGIRSLLHACQLPDGSFRALPFCSENDPRFTYSACIVCKLLTNDFSLMRDADMAARCLSSLQTHEGGFGDRRYAEAQGGMTFC